MIKILMLLGTLTFSSAYAMFNNADVVPVPVYCKTLPTCNACNAHVQKTQRKQLPCGHLCCYECFYYSMIFWCNSCKKGIRNPNFDQEQWEHYLANTYNA